MRLFISVIATAAMFFAASAASAALVFSTSTNDVVLLPGETVTIDITMTSDGEGTLGIGASAAGYDASVISYVAGSGLTAEVVLNAACVPSLGCFGGIPNLETTAGLNETTVNGPSEFVRFLTAVTLTASTGTGAIDPGVATGIDGDPQFQLTFVAGAPGTTVIEIGSRADFGDEASGSNGPVAVQNSLINVTVVPEPGTALLMGLGLAGLSAAGRRE